MTDRPVTTRIAVAFSREEALSLWTALGPGTLLLALPDDVPSGAPSIAPSLPAGEEANLAAAVRDAFLDLERTTGIDALRGFANNFFECAVAPAAAWIATLDTLLQDSAGAGRSIAVWFARQSLVGSPSSAYYMAEHESQGVRFYDRASVLGPYLVEVSRRHGIAPAFLGRRSGLGVFADRLLRLASVFAVRAAAGLAGVRRRRQPMPTSRAAELLAVTRAPAQTTFLEPLLEAVREESVLVAGEIFVGGGRNRALAESIGRDLPEVHALELTERSAGALLRDYARVALRIVRPPVVRIAVRGVELELAQAVAEVFVMLPDLLSYRRTLYDLAQRAGSTNAHLLISTEQKSPYAFADAWVARRLGLACAHLMQCDQHARPLPFPVYGDFFVADSAQNARAFSAAWGDDHAKVRYIGTIKALPRGRLVARSVGNGRTAWCFFTQPVDLPANLAVIEALRAIAAETDIDLLVKLHPRDKRSRYRDLDGVSIVADGEMRQDELFGRITHAVSFPSGVILDLLFADIPFALLQFGPGANAPDYQYFDPAYRGNVRTIADLAQAVRTSSALDDSFAAYRDRFLKRQQIISDPDAIRGALLNLHRPGNAAPQPATREF